MYDNRKTNYKLKVLVPKYIIKIIKEDSEFLKLPIYSLCNMVIKRFSCEKGEMDNFNFGEKAYLQFEIQKKVIPYYTEILGKYKNECGYNESAVIRNIFLKYALLPQFMREYVLFKQELSYLQNNKATIYSLEDGIIEVEKLVLDIDYEDEHLILKINNSKSYKINEIEFI